MHSLSESVANTAVGLVIAFFAQKLICWAYNIQLSSKQNMIMVFWMTIISVLRSYAVRRIANHIGRRKRGY